MKKKGNFLYKLIIVILLCIIGFSGYKVGTILYNYYIGTHENNKVIEAAKVELKKNKFRINWKKLLKMNPDTIAWIRSEDTPINYPIVQGKDNDYYLHRLFNGEYNFKGTLFADYQIKKPFKDFNTIVYGHLMKDGSMFKSLSKYDDIEYYRKHKTMFLATPEKNYNIKIFAMVKIVADSDLYKIDFMDAADKQRYIDKVTELSKIRTSVKVSPNDRLVMMSTCTTDVNEDRFVVYGKLVERK